MGIFLFYFKKTHKFPLLSMKHFSCLYSPGKYINNPLKSCETSSNSNQYENSEKCTQTEDLIKLWFRTSLVLLWTKTDQLRIQHGNASLWMLWARFCGVPCDQCNDEYSDISDLKNHYIINHPETLLCWCDFCGLRFENLVELQTHIRSLHRNYLPRWI